jgi:L-cysteine:1D-myo-inositol 2-amino-2-deoxy-alpha-D-glucopyranoside ligase
MSAAQGKILEGREFASHYVHAGMIGLDGVKMSKSLGNLVFVSKLVAAGRDPMAIRWALMEEHYSCDRSWSEDGLIAAEEWVVRLRRALSMMETAPTDAVIAAIISAQSKNLNTPEALGHIKDWIIASEEGSTGGAPGELSRALDTLLGIAL